MSLNQLNQTLSIDSAPHIDVSNTALLVKDVSWFFKIIFAINNLF